jgi:LysM repeat protein
VSTPPSGSGTGGSPPGTPAVVQPVPPAPPMTDQEITITVTKTVVELLEQGQEDQAAALLDRVLKQEPNHRLAGSFIRQIREDPQVMLGREYFTYTVQSGDTLSRIAQRFLRDVYLFYGLARYNGIKVPRQLASGQQIRVPGKAPPLAPAPSPPQPPSPSPPVAQPAVDPKAAERERAAAVQRHTKDARAAFAKQDLDGAIAAWDRVLDLDPDNANARLERQKAVDLKDRLKVIR